MCRLILIAALAVVLASVIPGRAAADILQFESLDLAVASSDLVVRGEVAEIISKKNEVGFFWSQVTIKVAETIKGDKLQKVVFVASGGAVDPKQIPLWQQKGEMLFCLNKRQNAQSPFQADYELRADHVIWAIALNCTPKTGGTIYSLDFKPLTDAKQILAAARAAAADQTAKTKSKLEWVVDAPLAYFPQAVLYPDSERVRAAAKKQGVKLSAW